MPLLETWQEVIPLVIFTAAIMGGVLTAFVRLTDRDTPIDIGLLHGRMGAAGVLILVVLTAMGEETSTTAKPAAALFMLTVIAGAALYFIIRRKGILPKTIIFVHAALAIGGLAVLLYGLPFK